MKLLLTLAGAVMLAFGILFALQGGGIVRWPAESFMIDQRVWIENGIVLVLIGLAALFAARRIRRN